MPTGVYERAKAIADNKGEVGSRNIDFKLEILYILLLRQREEWIRFSYSNEDIKDEERRKGWVVDRRLNVMPSAKRAPCPRTTPGASRYT
jgi:hypothetical protein